MGDFEVAIRTRSFGVDYTLWDAFPVEMGQLLKQVYVLHKYGPGIAGIYTVLVVINRCAEVVGQGLSFLYGPAILTVRQFCPQFSLGFLHYAIKSKTVARNNGVKTVFFRNKDRMLGYVRWDGEGWSELHI
jgi:hypothetical protein